MVSVGPAMGGGKQKGWTDEIFYLTRANTNFAKGTSSTPYRIIFSLGGRFHWTVMPIELRL